jgi:hypothetical protein
VDSNSYRINRGIWLLGDYDAPGGSASFLSTRHTKENTMTASTRNRHLVRGFVVGALAIGALGLTAPLAAAETASPADHAVVKAPAERKAPRPAPQPKPATDKTEAKPDRNAE